MKVALINPDYMKYSDPPLGLAYLASYIKDKLPFIEVLIIDQLEENSIIKKIKKIKPEIIGIPSVSANYYYIKQLQLKLKSISPNSLFVIGGSHITTMPDSFKDSNFDVGIIGEGEITFCELINNFYRNKGINKEELTKIKGLIFKDNNKIINTGVSEQIKDLDKIPMPERELLNMKYYSLPTFSSGKDLDPGASMFTSRGCPYNCRFCASSCFWGSKIRFFSAKKVVDEMEMLYKKYNYKKICIYDDLFTIYKERLKEIIELLRERKILGKLKFFVYGRANNFDEETAKLLKEMGVEFITFGLESGSQKVLNYLKRDSVTVNDNRKALEIAKKYGIEGYSFFMIGSPYETMEDIKKTIEFIKENCGGNFIVYQTTPLPGTEIWDYAIKNKIIKPNFFESKQKEFVDIDTSILLSKEISKEEFVKAFNELRSLHMSKNKHDYLTKFRNIRLRHIAKMLSPVFIKKAFTLRKQFIKKIFKV